MTPKLNKPSASSAEMNVALNQLFLAFVGLFLVNLLLRVFYIRYDFVNGDEGVRALTAVRMLEGARLYADVVTDKPPGASWFYAAVFAVLGRSMKAVHLAAIVWNFATSVVVYLIAARFYNRRIGLLAALLFVYFSTNYFTQDVMAANTELLMALPYTAAFYFFMIGADKANNGTGRRARIALVAAGLLTGLAMLFKQIGVLNLAFFAAYEFLAALSSRERDTSWFALARRAIAPLSLVAGGFAFVLAVFILWLKSLGALGDFWQNGIVLNTFYIDSEPMSIWIKFMIGRGLGYLFFNAVLWSLAGWATLRSIREIRSARKKTAGGAAQGARFDLAVALWAAVTLVAVMMSGRFFGHYFIPALPALALLASRGLQLLKHEFEQPAHRRRAQITTALLALLFLIGLFRCHHRTAVLAYETMTGTRTRWSANWGMTKREQEADIVSEYVRERIPAGEALYIWGYAHDVFWRTRCRPASRYLTPYYIDGRFADAESTTPASGEQFRLEAAAKLLEDLRATKPRVILDAQGNFKALPYAELVDFIEENYRDEGNIGLDPSRPFRVMELKDEDDKQREKVERERRRESKRRRSGL